MLGVCVHQVFFFSMLINVMLLSILSLVLLLPFPSSSTRIRTVDERVLANYGNPNPGDCHLASTRRQCRHGIGLVVQILRSKSRFVDGNAVSCS